MARPLLEPLSRGISVIGTEPRQAHALKLGGNFLISAMIHSLGESFVYAAGQGIDPEVFLETVNSALFQSPFYAAYGKVMLHPPNEPGATIDLGAKDLRLLREAAAERRTSLSLADNLAEIFAAGAAGRAGGRGLGRRPVPHGSKTRPGSKEPVIAVSDKDHGNRTKIGTMSLKGKIVFITGSQRRDWRGYRTGLRGRGSAAAAGRAARRKTGRSGLGGAQARRPRGALVRPGRAPLPRRAGRDRWPAGGVG